MKKSYLTPEARHEHFRASATKRTQSILNRLKVLSNCSNKQQYAWTDAEIDKIFDAIEARIHIVRAQFKKGTRTKFML